MVALDVLVVTTALGTIRLDLQASVADLEWTVNAYSLSFAVLLMPAAALGDRFGRRRLLAVGLAVFAVASAACAVSPGVGWLIAARAVQGAGAALVMPLSLALLSVAFPPERRAWAMGIFSGVTGIAVLGGPLVGGAVTEGIDWPWIFWLNVPLGLLAVPLVLRRIEESFGPRTAVDGPGAALVTGASLGLVWGLVRGNSAGWESAEVVGALVAGVLLAAAFVAWELRAREPMLPMGLFRARAFSSGNAANFLMLASLFGAVFFMAQFLQTAQGYGPLGAGLRLLPWTATLFTVAPIAGALVERVGERLLVTLGLSLQALGMGWIAVIAAPHMEYASLIPPLIVAGCGVSMAMPASQNVVINAVAADAIGKASGILNMGRQLGGAFGIAILVAVFAGAGGYGSAQAFSDGFAPALAVSAALSLGGALCAAGLPRRRPAPETARPLAIPQTEGVTS
jgi:EmrB/QacA subfamily drug resistance transporter